MSAMKNLLLAVTYSTNYSSPTTSLVLTDSFEKLPDQIMYPYTKPYDLQKHSEVSCELSVSTKEAVGLLYDGV
uniref:Uncharacterized protein n=1 Tax=Timema poppense TaxID=170557 RepID=A0A7R9DUY0_TIMPO|nr:unnamed protein product [Timema poppensis]